MLFGFPNSTLRDIEGTRVGRGGCGFRLGQPRSLALAATLVRGGIRLPMSVL